MPAFSLLNFLLTLAVNFLPRPVFVKMAECLLSEFIRVSTLLCLYLLVLHKEKAIGVRLEMAPWPVGLLKY